MVHVEIAAEELSVPLDKVRCVMPDTSVTPFDRSSTSSRTRAGSSSIPTPRAPKSRAAAITMRPSPEPKS